jgi:hypothetical protein
MCSELGGECCTRFQCRQQRDPIGSTDRLRFARFDHYVRLPYFPGLYFAHKSRGGHEKISSQGIEAPVRQGAKTQEYPDIPSSRNAAGRDASAYKTGTRCIGVYNVKLFLSEPLGCRGVFPSDGAWLAGCLMRELLRRRGA